MKSLADIHWRRRTQGLVIFVTVMLIACGGAAAPVPGPTVAPGPPAKPAAIAPTPTTQPGATPLPAATATPFPTPVATPVPKTRAVTAKQSIILVVGTEPENASAHGAGGGIENSFRLDAFSEPLTWQSGDDQRIIPTSASVGWEQLAVNKWRFHLRRGVKFHNGEAFNARAALPSLKLQGSAAGNSYSYPYTGPFTASAVDDFTLEFTCNTPCPTLANTTMFLNFTAPGFLATTTEEAQTRQNMSFGPYKQVKWTSGVSITGEVYADYVPAGDHYEMQKGVVRDVTWLFRGEPQVMVAMVQTGEADIAWDVGVDSLKVLKPDQTKSGGSAEVFAPKINSLWGRETSKQKVRQAMAHAINCQEIIDSLYSGKSICRGNIIWPGVIGATERNTAPWKYDPDLSRRLLQEAGYNFGTKLTLVSRGTRIPKQVEVLEAIQSYLADVGMKLELQIVDAATRRANRNCWAGQAVTDLLKERGRAVDPSQATMDEIKDAMAAATVKRSASCPAADLLEEEPSNETLDFGRQAVWYVNCTVAQSGICDTSPGGLQEKLPAALAASGAERQRLLADLADYVHDQVGFVGMFDLPVIYAVNPKLVWEPRFDRRVRVNAMSFNK